MSGSARKRTAARLFILLVGAASLSGVDLSPDHRKIEPIALATDDPPVVAAQRKTMEDPGRPDLPVPVFVLLSGDDPDLPARLAGLGGTGTRITPRLYTARIPRDASRYISNWPQVAYIESAKRARPLLDVSRTAVSADIVQAGGGGLPAPFTGAGMYVGVVDTGLDNSHLDFHTGGQGSPQRIPHWYPNPASASADTDGHGTHVAGIAAGNGFSSAGTYTGMAPGAEILIGKTSFVTTDIITAVQSLIAFAEANSRPIPVNLSLGLAVGPHDGTSGFESGINSLAAGPAGSRRLVAVAAGNETGANVHFQANLAPFGTTSIPVTLEAGPSAFTDLWADGNDNFTVIATMRSETVSVASGAAGRSTFARISVSNRVSVPPNGATHITVFFVPPPAGGPASIQLLRTRNGGSGKVDGYITDTEGTFSTATDSGTITEPANGSAVIAVGSFNSKNAGGGSVAQNLSSFSSFGPTRDGRLKPDITAPGTFVVSTRSSGAPATNYFGIVDGNYAILSGTSMATPHATGIAALAWQSNPALTGAQMRERIRRTAIPPTDGSTPPNAAWGYGKVNALAAVRNSVAAITAPATATPGSVVSLTSENSSAAFAGNALSYVWALTARPAGSAAVLGSTLTDSTGFTPDVPGNYTVGLTVSQATPSGTPSGSAAATIHVNNVPSVFSIAGPASSDNTAPVSFTGTGTDPDGQALTYRWVLVSRPAGSAANLPTVNASTVTFDPDVGGSYEIGLRVDDGLDNSALFTRAFTAGPAPQIVLPASGGGGGGGCGVATGGTEPDGVPPLATFAILFLPAGALAARRYARSRSLLRRGAAPLR